MSRTVLAHGVWDILHLGHIRHLQEAAKFGTLVVSVAADQHVNKGLGRPHFTAEQRAEAVRALGCVNEVVINDAETAVDLIHRIKPAVYVKGVDYAGVRDNPGLELEKEAVMAVGGVIKFTSSHKWSSSRLLKTETFSDQVCQYLDDMKRAGARDKILEAFDRADQKRILFVGESIVDVYKYVQGLGRASKELMLATVETGTECFAGGITAASKHGEWPKSEFLTHPATTGITKTRFVDADFNRKLFDVYSARQISLTPEERDAFRIKLSAEVGKSDVVIVNDFGHGLFGRMERDQLNRVGYLAINCQSNAGNYGFNLVTKYKQADYICIDDPEARLAAGMQTEPIHRVIGHLASSITCGKYLITHGRHGSHFAGKSEGYVGWHAPAMAEGGVDTMGAGDAVMAVTAPLVAAGLDMASVALVGNIVGAIKVSIVGHRRHVGRQEIIQTLEAVLA